MSGTITDISPSYIEPSPDNPRREVGDVTELAQSIASVGVIEPLVVRPIGKKAGHEHYQVIVGHRRLAAAQAAGSMWVPCIVRDYPEDQRAEIMLIENLQRVDLSPIEEGRAFRRLVDDYGWSQEKLGDRIGRSQSHISKRLSLVGLPEIATQAIHSGGMTIETGLELAKLAAKAPKAVEKMVEHHGGQIPSWVIAQELHSVEQRQKRDKLLAKLKADGVTIVKEPDGGWWRVRNDPKYTGPMTIDSWGPLAHVDAQAHRAEPCRAVYVDQHGRAEEACTEPARHREPIDASTAAHRETKAELEARREREEAEAAIQRRRAFAREVFARNLKPGDLLEVLVGFVLSALFDEEAFDNTMICELLGIETPRGDQWMAAAKQLATLVQGTDAQRLRLAAAAAATDGESRIHGWTGQPSFASQAWLRFLEDQGHELTAEERKHMTAQIEVDGAEVACRICGCTEDNACEDGCTWVEDPEQLGNLCSRCRDERFAAGALEAVEA